MTCRHRMRRGMTRRFIGDVSVWYSKWPCAAGVAFKFRVLEYKL